MPTDTGEATLPVVLGALRETLVGMRSTQGFLVTAANGPEGVQVSEQLSRLAWRVRLVTTGAEWFEQLLPFEAQFHALRRHQILVGDGLTGFRAVRSTDIFDGRKLLIEGTGALDMGNLVNVDFDCDGYTRFAQLGRRIVRAIGV